MSEAHLYALGLALACLSGVRAYLTVLGVGLAGLTGWVELPAALQVTMSPWVLGTAGALTIVEFFADKIPGVDSGWDLLQTLLRVPVGAFLAAATLSGDGQLAMGALAAGGAVTLFTHGVKASTRVAINASPEPVSNIGASLAEDVVAVSGVGLVFAYPWLALALVLGTLLVMALVVAWMVRFILKKIRGPRNPAPSH
ncbi:MAG: DUF4126 domain-containing protein [Arenimonas sp.]